ncbi:MAG: hypothetical protein SGPRY_003171 [Prymnesium sp.]
MRCHRNPALLVVYEKSTGRTPSESEGGTRAPPPGSNPEVFRDVVVVVAAAVVVMMAMRVGDGCVVVVVTVVVVVVVTVVIVLMTMTMVMVMANIVHNDNSA